MKGFVLVCLSLISAPLLAWNSPKTLTPDQQQFIEHQWLPAAQALMASQLRTLRHLALALPLDPNTPPNAKTMKRQQQLLKQFQIQQTHDIHRLKDLCQQAKRILGVTLAKQMVCIETD